MIKIILLTFLIINIGFANMELKNSIITIETKEDFEPSGLTYNDNILYSISDNGILLKHNTITRETEYIYLENKDYEGITISPLTKQIFIVEEGKDNIIELDKNFKIKNTYNINRYFNNKKVLNKKGNGLESLSFVKETDSKIFFYTANQSNKFKGKDKSAILLVEVDKNTKNAKIIEYFPLKIKDISGIDYKNDNKIYFISDKENTLHITDRNFEKIKRIEIPGKNQEGIYITNDKIFIAQDSGNILEIKRNLK